MNNHVHAQDGPALAAILAAGIGAAALGLATVLAEASPACKEMMNWWPPAGPLTGKTSVAVIFYLGSWLFLHLRWRRWELPFYHGIWKWALALIVIGWIGTFPPVYESFGPPQ
jgi:hypothetical protein